jgi:O-antigen/teichoic acid export membrane protein
MQVNLNTRNLLKHASGYGVALIVTRFGHFLVQPLVWNKLSAEDLGRIALAQLIGVIFLPLITLNIANAIQRFYFEWSKETRESNFFSLWLCAGIFALVVCLVIDQVLGIYSDSLIGQLSFHPYVRIVLWSQVSLGLIQIALQRIRLLQRLRLYNQVAIGSFVCMASLVVISLYVYEVGLLGYLLVIFANSIVWLIFHIVIFLREVKPVFTTQILSEALKYSVPSVPATMLDSGLVFDRYFLDKHVSLAEMGVYSVSSQISNVVGSLNSALKAAWMPLVFRSLAEDKNFKSELSKVGLRYLAGLSIFGLWVGSFSREVLLIMAPERLQEAWRLVPFLVSGWAMLGVSSAIGRGIDIAKKNHLNIVVSGATLGTGILLMAILVPRYGIYGAALGNLAALSVRAIVQVYLSLLVYPRKIKWLRLWGILAVFGLGMGVVGLVENFNVVDRITLKVGWTSICTFAIVLIGFEGLSLRSFTIIRK